MVTFGLAVFLNWDIDEPPDARASV
jgi:hypothetical protein